mgnify:CR=1 FL=1
MTALIINNKGKKNISLLTDLAKELGYEVKILTDEQFEDLALGTLMKKEKTGKSVSKKTILKKLKN